MDADRKFIWVKLIWSVVVIFSISLLLYIRHTKAGGIIGFGIYPYVLAPYILGLSVLLTLLRFIIPTLIRRSFIYLLTGTFTLLIGSVGIYLDTSSQARVDYTIHTIFYLNFIGAFFIFIDSFRK